MRYGETSTAFDVSDVAPDVSPVEPPVDGLNAVLDIAAEIDLEYGPDPGMTRVERLARFVRANFGDTRYARSQAGTASLSSVTATDEHKGRVDIHRVGSLMAVRTCAPGWVPLTPALARSLATALLIEAEDAERAGRGAEPSVPTSAYRGEF